MKDLVWARALTLAFVAFSVAGDEAPTPAALQGMSSREYCDWEIFNPVCGEDHVLVIERAKYGRMGIGRCVTKDYGNIGCETDVTSELERDCSGRRTCKKTIISLHSKHPCPADFKSYLEVAYECLKVSVPISQQSGSMASGSHVTPLRLSGPKGTIASLVARNLTSPLRIQVEAYQRIQVTLVDFTVPRGADPWFDRTHNSQQSAHVQCQPYAILTEVRKDGVVAANQSICGSARRESNVYTSSGSILDVQVTNTHEDRHFLIKYEALGCKPLSPPADAFVESRGHENDGDRTTVRCNATDEAWHLTCKGSEWIGVVGNCSLNGAASNDDWEMGVLRVSDFPFGILIVVSLGVAIGVAIGVVMLVGVLTYMRRRRRRKVRSRSNYILKPVSENGDDVNKSTCSECHTDCTPMLIKRSSMDDCSLTASTPCSRRQYACSWPRNRPLPIPSSSRPPEDLNDLEADVGLLPSEVHTPASPPPVSDFRTLPIRDPPPPPFVCPSGTIYSVGPPRQDSGVIPSVFTTFKPVRSAEPSTSNGQCPNVYFVEGGCRSQDAPYYFKFDSAQCNCPQDPAHKPDVVQGCAICQANAARGGSVPES